MSKKYEEAGKVYKTMDYNDFIFIQGNRDIKKSHVNKLKKKIQKEGYDAGIPITVIEINGKLVIIDGQHRFTACKELQLPIYFTYSTIKDDSIKEVVRKIATYNTDACNWKTNDFIEKEIKLNNKNYELLQKLSNELTTVEGDVKMCADFMCGDRLKGGKQLAALKDGEFIYTIDGEQRARAIDNEFQQLLQFIAPTNYDNFNSKKYKLAYLQIRMNDKFEFHRLKDKLYKDKGASLSATGSIETSYTSLVLLYNHGLKDKEKKITL